MNKKSIFKVLGEIIVLGMLSKGLSMVARILMTRNIGLEGMSLFSLANPMMVLIITLSQLGLPTAIATLISKNPTKDKKIFCSGLLIAIGISIILMVLTTLLSPTLAENILKNEAVTLTLYGLALLIPLVSLSSLLKGYFIGHNLLKMTARSSIIEEIARIIFIIFFLDKFSSIDPSYGALGAVIGVCVGEVFQSLYLICESNLKIYKSFNEIFDFNKVKPLEEIPGILHLSLPITLGRIVGSITYFFEPIIVTNLLLKSGFSSNYITLEYGIFNGYAMPLLLLPGFFSLAIGNYLLPNLSKSITNNEISKAKKQVISALLSSLTLGIFVAVIYYFGGDIILKLLYNTSLGSDYIKLLAFPFILYYLESPIMTCMHALGLTKIAFKTTVIASIMRIITLLIFTKYYSINAVWISIIFEIAIIVCINGFYIYKKLFRNNVVCPIISQ